MGDVELAVSPPEPRAASAVAGVVRLGVQGPFLLSETGELWVR
jgi:hypothetical protein